MSLVLRMNILSALRPCAIISPSSSMKHPRCVNRTYIPWSTICPTDTIFFVIVGTCNTFISFPFCPTWLRGTSTTCSIACKVSTTPGCFSFYRYENHSFMARHMVQCSGVNVPHFVRFRGGFLHRICLVSHHEGRPLSYFFRSLRSFGVVRPLPISLFGPHGSGFGLLPAFALLVALLAATPTFRVGLHLPVFGAAMTRPACGGSGTVVGTSCVPSFLLVSVATVACRPTSSSTPTGPFRLRVQHSTV